MLAASGWQPCVNFWKIRRNYLALVRFCWPVVFGGEKGFRQIFSDLVLTIYFNRYRIRAMQNSMVWQKPVSIFGAFFILLIWR